MNDRQRIAELEAEMLRVVKAMQVLQSHAAAMASAIAALQHVMRTLSEGAANETYIPQTNGVS